MADSTQRIDPEALSAPASWERWIDSLMTWAPYATLAVSLVAAQFGDVDIGDRALTATLALIAAVWTWLTFTQAGAPTTVPQPRLRLYFAGFLVLAVMLMFQSSAFLIYGIAGFFHAALLRPWPMAFLGIGAAGLVVHSHIVITESTPATWAIYLGIVVVQTVTVFVGLYAGLRISEVAEARQKTLDRLEMTIRENEGLHAQLVAQAREAGTMDERQRMAREIHDTIAQGLTGVITQVEAVEQSWGDEAEVRRRLASVSELARQSLDEARRSVQAIRPGALDNTKLPEALMDVTDRWSEANGIPVQANTTGERRPLRPEVELVLLRAAQESLANIAKHADAGRAGVTLSFMDDSVALDIRDDGNGFSPAGPQADSSFGLAAMRQRVEQVQGKMSIESAPGEGTAVSIRVPTAIGEPDD